VSGSALSRLVTGCTSQCCWRCLVSAVISQLNSLDALNRNLASAVIRTPNTCVLLRVINRMSVNFLDAVNRNLVSAALSLSSISFACDGESEPLVINRISLNVLDMVNWNLVSAVDELTGCRVRKRCLLMRSGDDSRVCVCV
jgi:hypothetical protein